MPPREQTPVETTEESSKPVHTKTDRRGCSAGLLIGVELLASCAAASPDTTPLQTHYIHIQDAVNPRRLYVHVGDEVRWQNLRHEPVKISLLGHLSGSGVSCQTGFSRFGSLDDTATIPPNAYVPTECVREPLLRPCRVHPIQRLAQAR